MRVETVLVVGQGLIGALTGLRGVRSLNLENGRAERPMFFKRRLRLTESLDKNVI